MSEPLARKPWEREPNEPLRWYERFELYRIAGPKRTILSAYNAYLATQGETKYRYNLPGAWTNQTKAWRWKERAEAWDVEQLRLQADEVEAERAKEREQRIATLRAARQLVSREIAELVADPAKIRNAPFVSVVQAMAMVMREQRSEYGEAAIITRTEQTGPGGGPIDVAHRSAQTIDTLVGQLDAEGLAALMVLAEQLAESAADDPDGA